MQNRWIMSLQGRSQGCGDRSDALGSRGRRPKGDYGRGTPNLTTFPCTLCKEAMAALLFYL
jgi:hypothetical protein